MNKVQLKCATMERATSCNRTFIFKTLLNRHIMHINSDYRVSGSYLKQIHISNDGPYKITTTMTFVYKKNQLELYTNATKFYLKKVRTKRTRLEQDQTNYIHQKKMKIGPIYESSVYQALRKRTYHSSA